MTATARDRLTSAEFEAFLKLPENQERRFELHNGQIIPKMVTEEHGVIVANLVFWLKRYLAEHPIGRLGVEVAHRAPDDDLNVCLPDISLMLSPERAVVTEGAVPVMPDLAIEVKSRHQTYKELREKAAFYLQHGTRAVWLVFPEKQLVETYTSAEQGIFLAHETLTGGNLLPNFSLVVAEIFQV